MLVKDIMTSPAVTVGPDTTVRDTAKLLVFHRISAVPVIDTENRVIGIVSEGDLMRRRELGTEPHQPWWMAFATPVSVDEEYHKSVADAVEEVMTRDVVKIREDASIIRVAEVLARHHIKRVPVVRNHKCIGVVSRADLVRAFSLLDVPKSGSPSSGDLREQIFSKIREAHVSSPAHMNLIVTDGVVDIWGTVADDGLRIPLIDAVKSVPGVKAVHDHIAVVPTIWAE